MDMINRNKKGEWIKKKSQGFMFLYYCPFYNFEDWSDEHIICARCGANLKEADNE